MLEVTLGGGVNAAAGRSNSRSTRHRRCAITEVDHSRRPGQRGQAERHLLLEHQHHALDAVEPLEPTKHQDCGHVVRQVGHDPQLALTSQRPGVDLECIGLDQLEPVAEAHLELAQVGHEPWVALDRDHPPGAGVEKGLGQATRTRADLEHSRGVKLAGRGGDAAQDRRIEQKMLPEPLVGPQALMAQLLAELGRLGGPGLVAQAFRDRHCRKRR